VHDPEQHCKQQKQFRFRQIAAPPQHGRGRRAGDQCRKRRIAGHCRNGEPQNREGDECSPGTKAEQEPDEGRHAFAALKAEPDRKQMAEKGAERGDDRSVAAEESVCDGDRGGALEHVTEKRRRGKAFSAGAQDVGGADIARADGAHIRRAGEPSDQHTERNGAAQIAE
jgi:hypothetical protein